MALKIRFPRYGAKHNPTYRVVVAESTARRDGRFVEMLGYYNPIAKGNTEKVHVNLERADYGLSQGAQPTDTARHLIKISRK